MVNDTGSYHTCRSSAIMDVWSEERVVCAADDSGPALRWQHGIPFRVIVGFTCVLSVCGATLIIASYVFFKSLRNRARLILLHISLMDLGTVVSKFVGIVINFDRYYVTYNATCTIYHTPSDLHLVQGGCEGQAFFSHFFTIGSVLWTISLSVYLYFLLVHYRTSYAQLSLYASYFLCYGLSLLVCVWLLLSDYLGYSGESWCSLVSLDLLTGLPNRYAAVFGYDLWVYFTMTFVPVLYLTVHLYLRDKVCSPMTSLTHSLTCIIDIIPYGTSVRYNIYACMHLSFTSVTCALQLIAVCIGASDYLVCL